eukprot:2033305-Lingulodinium_polyedra.AAC.1
MPSTRCQSPITTDHVRRTNLLSCTTWRLLREPRWARCNGYTRVQGQLNGRRVDAMDVGVPRNAPRPRSFQGDGD